MLKIEQVEYHRNGICGEGFHAILFKDGSESMLAIVFDGAGQCAVVSRDKLPDVGVAFGENSYRGDHYEDSLRAAIREHWEATEREWSHAS